MPTRCLACRAELPEGAAIQEGLGHEIQCGACGRYWIHVLFAQTLHARYPDEAGRLSAALRRLNDSGGARRALNTYDDLLMVLQDAEAQ